jgi:hypothetical protein
MDEKTPATGRSLEFCKNRRSQASIPETTRTSRREDDNIGSMGMKRRSHKVVATSSGATPRLPHHGEGRRSG